MEFRFFLTRGLLEYPQQFNDRVRADECISDYSGYRKRLGEI